MQHDSLWLVFIALFLKASVTFASDTIGTIRTHGSQYEYHINSGYINYASLDALFSDNVYSGGNLFYEIAFDIRNKILVQTSVRFSIFDRKPKSLTIDSTIVSPDSRFSSINHLHFELDNIYGFPVFKDRFRNLKLYISGSWFTSCDYVINDFMNPELLLSSIAPGFYGEYCSKKLLFYLRFSSPLLSYTCRNNYSFSRVSDYEEFGPYDFLKENSRIQFPNSIFGVFTQFGCQLRLSNHIDVLLEYHFRYLKDTEPRLLKSITSIYSIGFLYRVVKR
jgi:hypothetical protein